MNLNRTDFIDALHYRLFSWFERDPARRRGWQAPAEGAIGIATDIGSEREENQDRAAIASFSSPDGAAYLLAIVCDGMGGMAQGGECASLAISAFIVGFLKIQTAALDDRLRQAAEHANASVHRRFGGKGGSTLSALCFTGAGRFGVNVGDTRIYCRLGDGLRLLTTDDTLAAHRPSGQGDPNSRSLLQYIGIGPDLLAHVIEIPSECEVVLIASDGAHSMPADALQSLAMHAHSASELTRRVVQTAQWMGSRDNGTAVCLEMTGTAKLPQVERAVWLLDPGGELHILNPTDGRLGAGPDRAQESDLSQSPIPPGAQEARPPSKGNRTRKRPERKSDDGPGRPTVQVEITEILEPPSEGES